jgi:hypothetical protein
VNFDGGNGRKIVQENEVPVGEWFDVPKDQLAVVNVYYDKGGVLRSSEDDSCVVWHVAGRERPKCRRKGLEPIDIVYDPETKAPWCPDCWPKELERREMERILRLFEGENNGS